MIKVHRLNGKEFFVNCELIKFVESTPDTILTLLNNEKLMVRESIEEIVTATRNYKRAMHGVDIGADPSWKSPQS